MRDVHAAVGNRIEIGVEYAGPVPKLELQTASLPDLQCRAAEMADQLRRAEADKAAANLGLGWNLLRCVGGRLRSGSAGGEEDGRSEDQTAHGPDDARPSPRRQGCSAPNASLRARFPR